MLKLHLLCRSYGTAETVPFHKTYSGGRLAALINFVGIVSLRV